MDANDPQNTDLQAAQVDSFRIGQRIVEFRNRRGWSQRELARRAGLLPSRLSKLERALSKEMKLEEVLRLALALQVGLDELAFEQRPQTRLLDLVRELEALGTPEEITGLARLLQLLLLGYGAAAAGEAAVLPKRGKPEEER